LPPSQAQFDVERFRSEPVRLAVSREVECPTLVLGSTQPPELVDPDVLRERDTELVRRRGGGGAVLLEPGAQLWVDAWVPRDDPLWTPDVSAAAEWVGAWWMDALAGFGLHGFEVHTGRSVPGAYGELVCFAGRGPGEVLSEGRKVVGLSQWRAREGALFMSCAYGRWDPLPMLELMDVDDRGRGELAREVSGVAVGLGELNPPVPDLAEVREQLLASFPLLGLS
jgi:lipoate---protein ligase